MQKPLTLRVFFCRVLKKYFHIIDLKKLLDLRFEHGFVSLKFIVFDSVLSYSEAKIIDMKF